MSFLLPIVGGILASKAIGAGIKAIAGGGKKSTAAAASIASPLQARRDDAAAIANRDDAIRRRQGTAADQILNGVTGAEAAIAPGKLVLGS